VFVGAGPGAVDLLTRRGRDRLAAADVVVADRASLTPVIDRYAPVAVERVMVGRTAAGPAWDLDAIVALLVDHHRAGRQVVRLKSGDLFVCARTAEEVTALRDRSVECELVPGVSAAVAAPLAAGAALLPAAPARATVVAGNDDPRYPAIDWAGIAAGGGAVVVLMGRAHQRAIADHLIAGGRSPATPVHLVHGATRDDERIVATTLADLGTTRLPAPATAVIAAAPADLSVRATPADLSVRATQADLSVRATQADLSVRATQADLSVRATPADLSVRATQASVGVRAEHVRSTRAHP
jgi:siroheme synthase